MPSKGLNKVSIVQVSGVQEPGVRVRMGTGPVSGTLPCHNRGQPEPNYLLPLKTNIAAFRYESFK